MAKCIRCGGSFLTRGKVKLKDELICGKCFKELGFTDKTDVIVSSLYSYNDIKDGKDAYQQKKWAKQREENDIAEAKRLGLFYSDYRTLSDLDCEDGEMRIIEKICAVLDDEGCDTSKIEYEREPGSTLSAFVGDKKLYELKFTKDVKWIRIGDDEEKNRIGNAAGINKLVGKLVEAYKR